MSFFLQKNGPINVDCHFYEISDLHKTYFSGVSCRIFKVKMCTKTQFSIFQSQIAQSVGTSLSKRAWKLNKSVHSCQNGVKLCLKMHSYFHSSAFFMRLINCCQFVVLFFRGVYSISSILVHTCKNLIPMVVTRAMANSSKNHALLMCRI